MKDKNTIKAIVWYLIITFVFTWTLDFTSLNGIDLIPVPDASMFCPGLAAVIVKLIFYRHERFLGLKKCGFKYILSGNLIPLFYLGVSYGLFLFFYRSAFSGNIFSYDAGFYLTLIPFSLVTAAGEEIGWRGFLLPKLTDVFGFSKAALISGLIWSVWHYPVLIYYFAGSPEMWFQLIIFTAEITLIGIITAFLRLASNSILPAIVLHASHNYYDQIVFGPMTNTYFVNSFVGETGILTLLLVAASTLVIFRRNKNLIYGS